MKRTMREKYQSSRLHLTWAMFFMASWMTLKEVLTPEIWFGTMTLLYGGYSWVNYQKDKLYSGENGGGK